MGKITSSFAGPVEIYKPLLLRYARRILKDEVVAGYLVKRVLLAQYENNYLACTTDLLKILKEDLLNHCYYHQQSQIFDRPLIKVPIKRMILSSK